MFRLTPRLLHRGPATKIHIPPRTRTHPAPAPRATTTGAADKVQTLLDMRTGIGELLYQVSLVKSRQKRHETLLWVCVFSSTAIASVLVACEVLDVVDPLPPRPPPERKREKERSGKGR